jgi:hypothetical protein
VRQGNSTNGSVPSRRRNNPSKSCNQFSSVTKPEPFLRPLLSKRAAPRQDH